MVEAGDGIVQGLDAEPLGVKCRQIRKWLRFAKNKASFNRVQVRKGAIDGSTRTPGARTRLISWPTLSEGAKYCRAVRAPWSAWSAITLLKNADRSRAACMRILTSSQNSTSGSYSGPSGLATTGEGNGPSCDHQRFRQLKNLGPHCLAWRETGLSFATSGN